MEIEELCRILCMFLIEIRKQNGDKYLRETLYEIVLSLQHFMCMNGHNLKLPEHPSFVSMRNTLDNRMKELSKTGIVREHSQAQPISIEDKERMWQTGLLDEDTPEQLFNTILYLIGLHFALSACEEHKNLRTGTYLQFKVKVNSNRRKFIQYTEQQSKNYQGGLKNLHNKPKVVDAYENLENPKRCIVHLFEKYIAKRPSHDLKCSHHFYLRPLAKPTNPHIWYSCQQVGTQTLSKVIAKLCDSAGIPGKHTNHSLCSTAATRLFKQNVSEHEISNLTGHHSVAVRNYQRISSDKKVEQSNILYGQKCKNALMSTVTSADNSNFDIGLLMQITDNDSSKAKQPKLQNVSSEPHMNFTPAAVSVKQPIINIQQSEIVVEPVINVCASNLVKTEDGKFVLPPVKVALTININWLYYCQNVFFRMLIGAQVH